MVLLIANDFRVKIGQEAKYDDDGKGDKHP